MNLCRTNPSFIEGVDRWVDLPIAGSSSQSFFRWNSYSWDEDNGEKHVSNAAIVVSHIIQAGNHWLYPLVI